MQALLLGGQSKRHAEWVRAFTPVLTDAGFATAFVDYDNWTANSRSTDIEAELAVAARTVAGWDDYIVVAKSIGSVIATLGIGRQILQPRAALFLGFPLSALRELPHADEVRTAAAHLPRTVVVQNENDPFGTTVEVEAFFEAFGTADFRVDTVPGRADHDYVDFPALAQTAVAVAREDAGNGCRTH